MKIEIRNVFKDLIKKIKPKKIVVNKEAKVIKFNSQIQDNELNSIEDSVPKIRTGAYVQEKSKKKVNINKSAIKIFIGMIMLLLLCTSLNIRYKDYLSLDKYSQDVSSVAASSNIDNNIDMITQEDIVKATKAEKTIVATKKENVEKLVFTKPLNGEIQKMYSIDKVVYSKTLQQWKTHDGIDISASNGAEIKSIEKGIVDNVYTDPFYGVTIEIEHISGYRSIYSNLDENVYVTVGESVIKGQKIGKVGNTAIGEYLDEPHLHFRLLLNDKSQNPTYIFD